MGGTLPDLIKELTDIVSVTGNNGAFVALRENGSVVAWGLASIGGTLPAPIADRIDIVQVVAAANAFAALCANGCVVVWGNVIYGGAIPDEIAPLLTNVRAIYGNTHAFAALTANGRLVTWGVGPAGGDSSAVADQLDGKISYVITPEDGDRPATVARPSSSQPVSVSE
jgi:alpha-tubulin suppressor-like RCC1 family protein